MKQMLEQLLRLYNSGVTSISLEQVVDTETELLASDLELSVNPQECQQQFDRAIKSIKELAKPFETTRPQSVETRYKVRYAQGAILKIEIAMLKEKMKQKSK